MTFLKNVAMQQLCCINQKMQNRSTDLAPENVLLTVSGWMQKPEFVVEVNKITSTVHEATATVLQGLRLRAVEVLGALLEADSAAIKLQAVRMVLEASAHPVRNSAANSTLEFIERQLGSSHEFTKEELDIFLQ